MITSGLEPQLYNIDLESIRGGMEDFFDISLKNMRLIYLDLEDTIWKHTGYLKSALKTVYRLPNKREIPKRDAARLVKNYKTMPVRERIELTLKIFEKTPVWVLEHFGNYMAEQINPFSKRFIEALYGIQKFMMSYDIYQVAMPTKRKLEEGGIPIESYLVNDVGLDEQGRTTLELSSVAQGIPSWPRVAINEPRLKLFGLQSKMETSGIEPDEVLVLNDRHHGEQAIDSCMPNIVKSDELPEFFEYLFSLENSRS